MRTGIAGFNHQNVPLWYWMANSPDLKGGISGVEFFAVFGRSHEQANAIRILQSLGRSTPSIDEYASPTNVIKTWLADGQTREVANAALYFLRTNGNSADLDILTSLRNEIGAEHKNVVAATIIALSLKEGVSEGFKELIELDPDPLKSELVGRLFSKPESISTAILERALALKSDPIRENAAKLLKSRHAVSTAIAERLMTDSNPEVRLLAVDALDQQGKSPDDATIKKALIVPTPKGGLFGIAAFGNHSDDSWYVKLKQIRLSKLSYEELRKAVRNCNVYDHLEVLALNERYTRRNIEEIRSNLGDAFKKHFEGKIAVLASQQGADTKLLADTRGLERFLRDRLTSSSLAALCKLSDSQDLTLVRKTLDENDISFSANVLEFLAHFGDWSDRDRIISFTKKYSGSAASLLSSFNGNSEPIAAALYAVGKSRLVDLLNLAIPSDVRRHLIKAMSRKDINALSDDIVLMELNNEDDQFRKSFALKCVQAFSRSSIRKLLRKYADGDSQRYYNSIHWLDLGVSLPQKLARKVANFQLDDQHE
jgi:hypothetical protein